jgi:pimeloyl-ACP methyl ester carboxylesterase
MSTVGKHIAAGVVLVTTLAIASAAQQPTFRTRACASLSIAPDSVAGAALRCGIVAVPQARANDGKRLRPVDLPVIIYSNPSARGTPLMLIAGGPGESAIDATQRVLLETPLGQMLLRERPVIAFDRRGIHSEHGRTAPDLGALLLVGSAPRAEAVPIIRDSIAAAAAVLRQQGVEARYFTTLAALDDIADVVHALGFERVILFGASYGTRDVLQFMRRHPGMVESAILDGVAPPMATTLLDSATIAADALEVFSRVMADCATDNACAAEYAGLSAVLTRFNPDGGKAIRRTANLPDSGGWRTLQVSSTAVISVLGLASTSESIRAEVPAVLFDFATGDTLRSELAARVLVAAATDPALSASSVAVPLIRYAVLCGDRPQGEPFARDRTLCDALRVPFSGADAIAPVTSDIPTLLIASGYDAQTPPRLSDAAARTLSRAHRVVFPMVGHVAFARPVATACVAVVVESFLMQPDRMPATGCIATVLPAFSPRVVIQQQSRARP